MMYKIGLFSKITKTTIKTLRYYDEVGLLKPAYIDDENSYRYYTSNQLEELHNILALRQIGFTIDDCLQILKGEDISLILSERKKALEKEISMITDNISRIDTYFKEIKEERTMGYSVVIKDTPKCIVYSKRFIAPDYDSYFKLIPEIGEEVKTLNPNLKCAIPEYSFIIYHDGEYKDKDIDIEYCEAVDDYGIENENIKFKEMPSLMVASVLHKGAYSGLRDAYSYSFRWIEENGYEVIGNPRESYIDGIWNKENEKDWLTELQIPVRKK